MQCARTKEMICPAGVPVSSTSPRWLRDGDMVEIEIERLGRLRNYVRQEKD
jgi:2-keto-4-pentenoate hydratase/2-oxohepta-3-ene-1,7-dioic acid hydratase in catechol pathway